MKDQHSKEELLNSEDHFSDKKPYFDTSKGPRLKKMNRQPLDGDYFSLEELSELQREKQAQSENEFRYHSIREDLIKRKQEKSRTYRKGKVFGDVFNRNLEEVYDLDQLDSIQDYDQFKDEASTDETIEKLETQEKPIMTEHALSPEELSQLESHPDFDQALEEASLQAVKSEEDELKEVLNDPMVHADRSRSEDEDYPFDNISLDLSEDEEDALDEASENQVDLKRQSASLDLNNKDQAKSHKTDFLKAISALKLKIKNFKDNQVGQKFKKTDQIQEESQASSLEQEDEALVLKPDSFRDPEIDDDSVEFDEERVEGDGLESHHQVDNYSEDQKGQDHQPASSHTTSLEESSQLEGQEKHDSQSKQELDRPVLDESSEDDSQEKLTSAQQQIDELDSQVESDKGQALSDKVAQQTKVFREPILTDAVLNDIMVEEDITIEKKIVEDSQSSKDSLIKKDNFVSGAAWLSIGFVISRVIGALYVIPWASWFGEGWTQANTLYSAGYKPYSLFLAVGTAGFPSAIAKQMAYYHAQKEYRVADKLFKNSLFIMLLTGLVSGTLLYFLAPTLAQQSTNVNKEGAVMVLRSLVPPLLILPMMSFFRGYFQGFNDMKPSAVSQLLEQIARVLYMLVATYAIMKVYKGEITQAVVHSTFAAFIGAVASMIYLIIVYLKRLPDIKKLIAQSQDKIEVDFKESLKIMALDSLPFIILGSGIIIMQLVDTYSFGKILENTSILLLTEIDELYGVLSLDVDKLVMIIVSLSIALSSAFVPSLTGTFAKKDIKATSKMVHHILNVFFMVMIPSALGMAAIADNLYSLFYPLGASIGPSLLITAALSAIILGLYTVLSTILQSMNFRRLAVRFLLVGIFVKIILQFPLVMLLQAHGAILSTMLGLAVSSLLMWIKLERVLDLNTYQMGIDLAKIVVSSIFMAIAAMMWNRVFNLAFGPVGRLMTFVKVLLVVLPSVAIYLVLMFILGMISLLIGDRFKELQDKLRIRI